MLQEEQAEGGPQSLKPTPQSLLGNFPLPHCIGSPGAIASLCGEGAACRDTVAFYLCPLGTGRVIRREGGRGADGGSESRVRDVRASLPTPHGRGAQNLCLLKCSLSKGLFPSL